MVTRRTRVGHVATNDWRKLKCIWDVQHQRIIRTKFRENQSDVHKFEWQHTHTHTHTSITTLLKRLRVFFLEKNKKQTEINYITQRECLLI